MKLIQLCILGALATLAASSPITMAKSSNVVTPLSSIKRREAPAADAPSNCDDTCASLCSALGGGPDCIQECLPGCQQDADDSLPGPETTESTQDGLPVPADSTEGGGSAAGGPAAGEPAAGEPAPASPAEGGSPAQGGSP